MFYNMIPLHMKKYLLFFVLFALTCNSAVAGKRTTEDLKGIAASFINKHRQGKPRKANAAPSEMRVVIEKEQLAVVADDEFFVVLVLDEEAEPVLGYSETAIGECAMPPAFQWWLDMTNEALDKGDRKAMTRRRARVPASLPASIEPLITTKWWQSEPYFNKCPFAKNTDDSFSRCLTGCGATGMAQIMNYHKYPQHGTGSHGYDTPNLIRMGDYEGHHLFMDFSETTFDWAHMKDDYSSGYTEAEADAVAELMLACGIAANMNYGIEESSSFMTDLNKALNEYFGYDRTLEVELKYDYRFNIDKWLNRIYYNIKRHLPILYCGRDVARNAGHVFVLDGYDTDGWVHINWGWGGNYNGYFHILSLEVPEKGRDYSTRDYQGMICEIMPATYSPEVKVVNVSQPGMLSSLLPEAEYDFTEALKVNGDLNGSDILVLRNLCEGDNSNHFLYSLDMSDANIVSGGDCYYKNNRTSTNVFPNNMFYGCKGLYSVVLPRSITSIGEYAFYGQNKLTSVTIPEGVTRIGNDAFGSCTGLTSIALPNSLTSIGEFAFSACKCLTSVIIPDDVTSIGRCAFSGCTALAEITIPDGVTSIGSDAFRATPWYDSLPDGLVYIGRIAYEYKGTMPEGTEIAVKEGTLEISSEAFLDCKGLVSIAIPNSLTTIGTDAFKGCFSLNAVHVVDLSAWCRISFAGGYAQPLSFAHRLYMDGQEVQDLVIPEGITEIGSYAFDGCSNLTSVSIPSSVTSIGNSAFYDCNNLTLVSIPSSVTSIGNSAFYGCNNLTAVHICDLSAWCRISFGGVYAQPLYYAHRLYMDGQEIQDLVIPDGITEIGSYAFDGCRSLTSVSIPAGVTRIGAEAFNDCSSMVSVSIPGSVTDIGQFAFGDCSSLERVFCLAESVPSTGYGVFQSLPPMFATLYVPASALESYSIIEPWMSFNILPLDSLSPVVIDGIKYKLDVLAQTATVVANEANEAGYEGSVSIPASINVNGLKCDVTAIGNNAFSDSRYLTSVIIPESVTSIGARAFFGCSWLSSVSIPNSVTSIGPFAFAYCHNLESITIPEGVKSIGKSAFCACHSMAYAIIPSSVTSIGDKAFESCSGLNAVFCLSQTVYETGSDVFTQSSCSTATLYVPSSLLDDYSNVEPWNVFGEIKTWDDLSIDCLGYHLDVMARTASVRGGTDYTGNVIIPASIDVSGLPFDVTSFDWPTFSNCSGLTAVTIPGSISLIVWSAFYRCSNLKSVTISEGVEIIEGQAFAGCSNLTSVTIPESVWSIGFEAFADCRSLTSITIGSSVTDIGFCAFSGCRGLREIYCLAEEVPDVNIFSFQDVPVTLVTLVVPDDAVEQYKAHPIWGQFFIETVTDIKALPDSPGGKADIYSLGGSRLPVLQKGINIKDGRKILVK